MIVISDTAALEITSNKSFIIRNEYQLTFILFDWID